MVMGFQMRMRLRVAPNHPQPITMRMQPMTTALVMPMAIVLQIVRMPVREHCLVPKLMQRAAKSFTMQTTMVYQMKMTTVRIQIPELKSMPMAAPFHRTVTEMASLMLKTSVLTPHRESPSMKPAVKL